MGVLDRLRTPAPQCQAPGGNYQRCSKPGVIEIANPGRPVRVCDEHNDPRAVELATHHYRYPNGEKPDITVVLGYFGNP